MIGLSNKTSVLLEKLAKTYNELATAHAALEEQMSQTMDSTIEVVRDHMEGELYRTCVSSNGRYTYGRIARYYANQNIGSNTMVVYIYLQVTLQTGRAPKRGGKIIKMTLPYFLDKYMVWWF
jgi:hypothetical protein